MNSGVYEIVNAVNGKRYVGSALDFAKRWSGHRAQLKAARHHSRHLQSSWSKHGPDAFSFRALLLCTVEHLLMYEQIAIDALQPEYNVCRTAGNSLGCIRTPETRAKIAAKATGRIFPPRSAEHRAKISAVHAGRPKSPEQMAALQAGRAARRYSADDREAISEALKSQYESGTRSRARPPEYRHRIAETLSKLSADEVRLIKRLRREGTTGRALAARFGVPASTITNIVRGHTYRWVDGGSKP